MLQQGDGDGFPCGDLYGDGYGDLEARLLQADGDNTRSPEDGGDGWSEKWWLNGDGE